MRKNVSKSKELIIIKKKRDSSNLIFQNDDNRNTGRPRSFSSTNATHLQALQSDITSWPYLLMLYLSLVDMYEANTIATRSTDYRLRFGWRTMRIKDRPCRSACASLSYRRNVAVEQDDAQALDDTVVSRWRSHAIARHAAFGSLSHFIANFTPFRSAAT